MKYFDYEPHRLNYLAHISMRLNAIYMETPKVGCSTIKRCLQAIEAEGKCPVPDDVHDRLASPLFSPGNSGEPITVLFGSDDYFRFSFVRNPFTRALSAYLDKIAGGQWERDRRLPLLGFKPTDDVTFTEFLHRVADQPDHLRDIHWMSQFGILRPDRVKYHFIGRFERFKDDMEFLLGKINGSAKPSGKAVNWHATNASKKLKQYYGSEEIAVVRAIYANDFWHFGYSTKADWLS